MPLRSTVSLRIVGSGVLPTQEVTKSLPDIELAGNRRKEDLDFLPHLQFVLQLRNQQIGLEGVLKGTDIRIRPS